MSSPSNVHPTPPAAPWTGKRPPPEQLAEILKLHRQWRMSSEREGARADLRGADLSGAYLRGAYLHGANLGGADLREADLGGAYLRGADLRGAYLRGAYLRGADLGEADLGGADLREADLSGADLRGANLGEADLRGAYLRGADLSGDDLGGADLGGANLGEANLSGDDLGQTLQRIGPIDGWTMVAVQWADGPRIACGCRWFTLAEAREWWGIGCADRRTHGDLMLAGIDALMSICRAHGWTGCEVAS